MPLGFGPLGRRPIGLLNDLPLVANIAAGVGAVIVYTAEIIPATGSPVYVATEQFTTQVSDSRPSIPFNATMENAPRFKKTIRTGDGFGRMASSLGDLTISNRSGEYDTLIATPLDGATVIVSVGWRGISYDQFIRLYTATVETADVNEASVVLHFRDDSKRLDIPAQPNVYGGTGTTDGDANVKGKRKPVGLGFCRNVSAPLIDAVKLVYQVHDGQMQSVSAVYDRAVALPLNATPNYADYAALIGATITPGSYATCLALGLVRLGAKPDGTITVTAQCAVSNGSVVGYPNVGQLLPDTASLIHYLILVSGANIVVDTASIITVANAQPAAIGYWIGPDDSKTLREAIDDLMEGIGGYGGFRADRTFIIGIFTLPTGAVAGSYTNMDWFDDLKRPELPAIAAVPPKRWFVAYGRNFTLQPDVDATVDAGTQTLRKDPYSIAVSTDTTTTNAIIAAHLSTTDSAVVQAWFVNPADAVAEGNRRLVLYGGGFRSLYSVDLTQIAFALDIGKVQQLTDSRFSLSGGKSLTVVEIDNGFDDGRVTVLGFG